MTAVVDMYPKVFRRGYRRELLILALSIISYFLGLVMLTEVRGVSRVLYQTPTLRPQTLWLCTDPASSRLLRYLLFHESEHRPSVSSEYKVSPVLVLDVASQDSSHKDSSGQATDSLIIPFGNPPMKRTVSALRPSTGSLSWPLLVNAGSFGTPLRTGTCGGICYVL